VKSFVLLACLGAGVSACIVSPRDELIYGRADCRRSTEAEVATQYAVDRQVCSGRARATAAANWRARGEVGDGVMLSCMAQRGYIHAPRAAHDARCARATPGGGLSRIGG
jgi:hypothetical protein